MCLRHLLFVLPLLLLSACGGAALPPATPVTFADFCTEANADQRVSVEGYPRFPSMVMVSDTAFFELFQEADGADEPISVNAKIGTGKNQLEEFPDDFSMEDLKLHTDTNEVIGADDRIRVSGKVHRFQGADNAFQCYLDQPITVEAVAVAE